MGVFTLIRGAGCPAIWIGSVLFIWLAVSLCWAATRTTRRPRIPDVGFRGLEVTWSGVS
jgi:hypothetical protein